LNIKDKIACVTGASGMVGRRIVERLIRENYCVRVLSRASSYPIANVEHFREGIEDESVLKEFANGAHLFFHCAAEKSDESKMREVNVEGTKRIIEIIKASSIEYFCYISSAGVIGRTKNKRIDEKTACNPQTPYESTKCEAEKAVEKGISNCRTVILRPTNVVDLHWPGPIQSFITNSVIRRLIVFFKGAESAHIIHANDVADAALYFIDKPIKKTEIYFISRDDDPANTYGNILKFIRDGQNEEHGGIDSQRYYLPIWASKLIRSLFLRADVPPDACYTAAKLLSTGFQFTTSFSDVIYQFRGGKHAKSIDESRDERLISGGLWATGGKITVSTLNLFVNSLLARILSVDEMGGYFIALSFVMVAAVFAQFGLNYAIVKVVAEELAKGRKQMAVKSILFAFKFTGGVVAFLSFFLALKGGYWVAHYILDSTIIAEASGVLAIWVAVMAIQHLLGETFRGFADIRFASIFSGILPSTLVFFFTLGIWIAKGDSDLNQVISLFVIAGGISICIGGSYLWRLCQNNNRDDDKIDFKPGYILSVAWPMWLTNLMLFVIAQADLWILGIFKGGEGVAFYGAASRLAILIQTPQLIVNAVIPPHVAELHSKQQKTEFEQILRSTATISGFIGFFLFIVLGVFGDPILGYVFGESYRNASLVLLMISFGQFVTVGAGSCAVALMMTEHQKLMMFITMASGMVSIFMAVILVQRFGTEGVAFATASGLILQSLAMVIAVKIKINVWAPMYIPLRAVATLSGRPK
jgi:O-antigen/teichoic acid export membrane protein/nucleoside-diphosphate-sugar epimerase